MTLCTLGGKPTMGSSPEGWSLEPGVKPSVADFDLLPGDATKLLAGGATPVSLVIKSTSGDVTIDKLYVLHEVASGQPQIRRVRVADRRWFWPRNHILRRYNMRRHLGVKRAEQLGLIPTAFPVVPDVQHAPWSLFPPESNGGTRWTARQVLDDVMKAILKADPNGGTAVIDLENLDTPIENLELDDAGDQALNRVLAYLPEAQVAVDNDGTVRVYFRGSGGERRTIEDAKPPVIGGGEIVFVKEARVRPSQVHVLFTREIEIKLKAEEREVGRTGEPNRDDMFMENVLPVPDFTLNGRATGTWIKLTTALSEWGAAPGIGDLNIARLRKAFVPYMDLWAGMGLAGLRNPDVNWAARIGALQQHFRRTYRINRRLMDRIYSLREYRVAGIDAETGTRSKAMAWLNYSQLYTQRSLISEIQGDKDLSFAINVTTYPTSGNVSDANGPSAPAVVTILDHDQGIIRLNLQTDETRMFESLLPGLIENMPTGELDDKRKSIAFNAIFKSAGLENVPQLSGSHKVLVVMTAIPAAPNTDAQLHRVVIKPGDVSGMLPGALADGVGDARGPIQEIRIGGGRETARIAYVDSRQDDIDRAFGIKPGIPNFEGMVINQGSQAGIGQVGASIDAIARAAAARVWAEFSDRWQGQRVVGPMGGAVIDGFLDSLRHEVATDGSATTSIVTGSQAADVDLASFLPADVRAVLFKLAQPGK